MVSWQAASKRKETASNQRADVLPSDVCNEGIELRSLEFLLNVLIGVDRSCA
jgi:hypothetical protein